MAARPGRKRISDSKAARFCESLGSIEEAKERKRLIEECSDYLKKVSNPKLRAVLALLKNTGEEAEGPRFQRGTTSMGGSASAAVPAYVVNQCLEKAMHVSKGMLDKVAAKTKRQLFLFGVGCEEASPIPEKHMLIADFVAWYLKLHESKGMRLAQLYLESGVVKGPAGAFGYFRLGRQQCGEEDYDALVSNLTGEKVLLPNNLVVKGPEMDVHFHFEDNWSYTLCKFVVERDSWDIRCHKKFGPIAAKHCEWHGPKLESPAALADEEPPTPAKKKAAVVETPAKKPRKEDPAVEAAASAEASVDSEAKEDEPEKEEEAEPEKGEEAEEEEQEEEEELPPGEGAEEM